MSTEGWEFVAAAPLGGGESALYGIVAYCKRPCLKIATSLQEQ
ncbi:hypothetical protein [Moorena sp. SIOASIH]|nr:hypothetical protein [Moorena sp. SIOASIH]